MCTHLLTYNSTVHKFSYSFLYGTLDLNTYVDGECNCIKFYLFYFPSHFFLCSFVTLLNIFKQRRKHSVLVLPQSPFLIMLVKLQRQSTICQVSLPFRKNMALIIVVNCISIRMKSNDEHFNLLLLYMCCTRCSVRFFKRLVDIV